MIKIIVLVGIAIIVLGAIKHGELDKLNGKKFKDYTGEDLALIFLFAVLVFVFFITLLK